MAGTVSISNTRELFYPINLVRRYEISWTSDGDGNATFTTPPIAGILARVAFIPNGGSTQPSNDYDVTLTDDNGIDVLAGFGGNLSNSAASHIQPGVPLDDGTTTSVAPIFLCDTLDLSVTNGGASKGGKVILYVR